MIGMLIKLIVSAALFAVFVPGVFFTVPAGNSTAILAVHAVLFAVSSVLIWRVLKVVRK